MSLEFLKRIEAQEQTEKIKFKNVQVWPTIRVYLTLQKVNGLSIKSKLAVKVKIKDLFQGFGHFFRRYDYFFFTDSSVRKEMDGLSVDRCVGLISASYKRSLIVETPHSYDSTQGLTYFEKRRVSSLFLHAIMLIYKKLFLRNPEIKEQEYLESIINNELPGFDYKEVVRKFWSKYIVYKYFLKLYKPKAVFVVCSYTNQGLTLACKMLGITIIEAQHGLINKAHEGYNFFREYDKRLFPDYLLSYGNYEKKVLKEANSIPFENVIPLGNYGLETGVVNFENEEEFRQLKSRYNFTFCISGQAYVEEELYAIGVELVKRFPDILILYVPRNRGWIPTNTREGLMENIRIIRKENIYNMIRTADYHVTASSSCAYEALALQKRNVLFNVKGLSETYLADLLEDTDNNLLLTDVEDFEKKFYQFASSISCSIEAEYMVSGYVKNISRLNQIV